jgi:intein/homing endonuclease
MGIVNSQFKIQLEDLNCRSIFVNWGANERTRLFKIALSSRSLTKLASDLDYDLPTLSEVKNGFVKPSGEIYLSLCSLAGICPDITGITVSSRNHGPVTIVSDGISPELLGLLHSDGILRANKRQGVNFFFCNQELALVSKFKALLARTFHCKLGGNKDERDGTIYVRPPCVIGRLLIRRFGEKRGAFLPPEMSVIEIAEYIRGLFDGDGTIVLRIDGKRIVPRIKIVMKHEELAQRIKALLHRIGIYSRIQHESGKGHQWCVLDVARRESVSRFSQIVGSNHPKKRSRMDRAERNLRSFAPA